MRDLVNGLWFPVTTEGWEGKIQTAANQSKLARGRP